MAFRLERIPPTACRFSSISSSRASSLIRLIMGPSGFTEPPPLLRPGCFDTAPLPLPPPDPFASPFHFASVSRILLCLFHGQTQRPHHFSIPVMCFSASFISALILSMSPSTLANCPPGYVLLRLLHLSVDLVHVALDSGQLLPRLCA